MWERLQGILVIFAISPYWQAILGTFALTVVTFFANARARVALDYALRDREHSKPLGIFDLSHGATSNALQGKHLVVPERLWTYDDEYLERFAKAANVVPMSGYGSALQMYVKFTLRRWDIAFAAALMIFTALSDLGIAHAIASSHPSLSHFVAMAAGMGILYGVADIAEDLKLASILATPDRIDAGQTASANFLTRVKFVAIILSGVGIAVFLTLSGVAALLIRPPTNPAVAVETENAIENNDRRPALGH